MNSIYELSFKDSFGNDHHMDAYRGKTLLLVNTATKCGFAPQLTELEKLSQDYRDKGLVVIGFPCDQFAGQEPVANEDMVHVCQLNFGVTFLLSEKIDVNGPNTHPLFKYLKSHSKSGLLKAIKWNFTKFLVSADGKTIKRFAPATTPESMRKDIETLLSES